MLSYCGVVMLWGGYCHCDVGGCCHVVGGEGGVVMLSVTVLSSSINGKYIAN